MDVAGLVEVCGLALQAAGYAWVASIAALGVEYLQLGAACTIAGIGTSFCFPTVAGAVMGSVALSEAGVASGANSAIRELGGVVGVAVLASVFIHHGGYRSPQAFINGFTAAIWVAVALSAIGILAAIATGNRRRAAVDQADVAQLQPQPAWPITTTTIGRASGALSPRPPARHLAKSSPAARASSAAPGATKPRSLERSPWVLTGQAAWFCSAPDASSQVWRTSRGVR